MNNFLDKLFISLTKEMTDIHKKGLCETNIYITGNPTVDDFLKLALDLAKDGYVSELIDSELSFNINKHILNRDIDEIELRSMEIIKLTLQPIISLDIISLIYYSKYFCSEKTVREIDNIIYASISYEDIEKYRLAALKRKDSNYVEFTDTFVFPKKKDTE